MLRTTRLDWKKPGLLNVGVLLTPTRVAWKRLGWSTCRTDVSAFTAQQTGLATVKGLKMRRYLACLTLAILALAVLGACTPSPTPAAPTVGAAATSVATAAQPAAATAMAAASPVATQVVAVASPAVATAAAGASPVATAAAGASPIRITDARLGASDVTISLQNASSTAVDLTGWRLRVGSATAALPSGARVAPNESVTLHSAAGTNTARDIYLGQESSALMQGVVPGASVELVDQQGNTAASFRIPG